MTVNTISDAKAHLSSIIARVQRGEEVIIKKAGRPVAIIRPYGQQVCERRPGALRGRITLAPDFDELPSDIARALGLED